MKRKNAQYFDFLAAILVVNRPYVLEIEPQQNPRDKLSNYRHSTLEIFDGKA